MAQAALLASLRGYNNVTFLLQVVIDIICYTASETGLEGCGVLSIVRT